MSQDQNLMLPIIATGEHVALRDWLAGDVDTFLRFWTQGEWLQFDAPWEDNVDVATAEGRARLRERFLRRLQKDVPTIRKGVTIAMPEGTPLGWVNRYGEKDNPRVWYVGIDICKDANLNRGFGTEALRLWVDYLFRVSDIHKLCLDTWSFNPRMVRCAEKAGFLYEGRQREMQEWRGEWLDLLHFGILRDEWQGRITSDTVVSKGN